MQPLVMPRGPLLAPSESLTPFASRPTSASASTSATVQPSPGAVLASSSSPLFGSSPASIQRALHGSAQSSCAGPFTSLYGTVHSPCTSRQPLPLATSASFNPRLHPSESHPVSRQYSSTDFPARSVRTEGDGARGVRTLGGLPRRQQQRRGFRAQGLPVEGVEGADVVAAPSEKLLNPRSVTIPVGDREIIIETGRMGRHANGAVTVRDGDTMVYCTVCSDFEPSPPGDFAPLSVTYQAKFSAAGRTSGGYFKREGKPKDAEVLVSRLIDRPMRPMMAKGYNYETQILAWVWSYDDYHSPDALAIIAAGAALAVSDIPVAGLVAGVRVGCIDGEFVVNPPVPDMARSTLDLVVAGTEDSVLMIEGYCDFFTEEQLLEAVALGQKAVAGICRGLAEWTDAERGGAGKPKRTDCLDLPPPELEAKIEAVAAAEIDAALRIKVKQQRGAAMGRVEQRVMEQLTKEGRARWRAELAAAAAKLEGSLDREQVTADDVLWEEEEGYVVESGEVDQGEVHIGSKKGTATAATGAGAGAGAVAGADLEPPSDGDGNEVGLKGPSLKGGLGPLEGRAHWDDDKDEMYREADVRRALKSVISKAMRRLIVVEGVRSDGRAVNEVRPIESSCGLLPRTHGSALFSRGETQALAVAVLGSEDMAQRIDSLVLPEENKRFYLHYSFPPSSVGETGRIGMPSRREIGHGMLAERALEPCIPPPEAFPYSMRLESNITESNGSSSMASVCGGCLALLDAGVPLVSPVAGVAMGLILKTAEVGGTGDPVVLTDILGSEDALGDMDFKVAGNETGVTAFQMDIKVTGITMEVMRTALEQAKAGRIHILREMQKCDPPPRRELSQYAPRCEVLQVPVDKISLVIGSGGKTIKSIIEDSKVDNIDIQDTGTITIFGKSPAAVSAAKARIEGLTMEPEVGKIYRDCPVKSIMPFGAFVELAPGKDGLVHISELAITKVEKVEDVLTVGQTLDVKLIEVNARGQMRLSHKAVLMEEKGIEPEASPGTSSAPNGRGSGNGRPAAAGGAEGGESRKVWKAKDNKDKEKEPTKEAATKAVKAQAPAGTPRKQPQQPPKDKAPAKA